MWFLNNLTSLRESFLAILQWVADSSKAIFLIIAAGFVIVSAPTWAPGVATYLTTKHDGVIIVNSPTIYTRQRLVNDRLSQTAWLKDQLEITKDPSGPFRSIDVISDGISSNIAKIDVGNSGVPSGDPKKSSESPDNAASKTDDAATPSSTVARSQPNNSNIGVEPTTTDFFRAKNAYREEVRSEMMEAQLDDRHDIDGNTIYRLAFGATVLPGTRTDALAVIKVSLSHDPDPERQPAIANEYNKLYEDWLRSMQKTMDKAIDPIVEQIYYRHLDPRLRTSLPRFVLKRVCELLFASESRFRRSDCVPVKGSLDDPDSQLAQTSKTIDRFAEQYLEYRKAIQLSIGEINVRRAIAAANDKQVNAFRFLDQSLDRWCDPQILAGIPPSRTTGAPDYLPAISGQSVQVRDMISDQKIVVECPNFDLPAERIVAGLFLYYKLLAQRGPTVRSSANGPNLDDLTDKLVADLKKRCPEGVSPNCAVPNLTQGELRCVAADYMREYLNFFGNAPLGREPIGRFLNMELLGPETGSCSITVSEIPYRAGVKKLRENLNRGTELYSYAISPKNLVQHISTALETRDTLQALVKAKGADLTSALESLRQKSDYNRAIEANPIVLGFGFATGSKPSKPPASGVGIDENVKTTEFGWLIAPQMRVGSTEREQVNGQYGLSAVVSVPAWWRAVQLVIRTCWVSKSALYLYQGQEMCTDEKGEVSRDSKKFTDVVRLPVSILEISHKLAFEVVQEPHLIQATTPDNPFEVTVGQPAELILRGSRLWRSTEVTLGSQRADEIVVLPDMEGIIARFKCVKMQKPMNKVQVKVFTSEGEADPEYASLTEDPTAKPCPAVLRDLGVLPGKRENAAGPLGRD